MKRAIIAGQTIDSEELKLAKDLRKNMTEPERLLWKHLRANRLNGLHFRRQQIIDGFIADFYCHSCSLVVEVDGGIHERQVEYDSARDRYFESQGIRVVRAKNSEVEQDIDAVLERIAKGCQT